VIDLSSMTNVKLAEDRRSMRVSGGARAAGAVAATDPAGLAVVTGSAGVVGMTGLTLGGGYGPLIGRFGLALDNLIAAEVVLADGRSVLANEESEPELFWALRGGGGNFGVVTAMVLRVHELPSVRSGMLIYAFSEAKSVLERFADIGATAPDELTGQLVMAFGPDGVPLLLIVPTWCGDPGEGERRCAPFASLGTPLTNSVGQMSYGTSLAMFDPFIVNGRRTIMEACWLPRLSTASIELLVAAMTNAVSPGCAIITHEFKGAASRIPREATAFGLRRDHVLIEILAQWDDQGDSREEPRHRAWAQATRAAFGPTALPGGYPNLLPPGETARAAESFGQNLPRLLDAKRAYDPDNVFRSAIPLSDHDQSRSPSPRLIHS
jgi:hypothetical protein